MDNLLQILMMDRVTVYVKVFTVYIKIIRIQNALVIGITSQLDATRDFSNPVWN